MPSELTTYALEDCLDALIDYRGKTPRKTESGIPLITAKVVKGGRIESPNEFIAPDDFAAWMTRGLPKVGDIVMTTEAPLGEVGQILKLPVALAQRIVTLRGKSGVLHNDYLLYALQSEPVQAQLRGRASGTTVVGIKQSELRKVKLSLPCFDAQIEVAGVLRSLDNRIDLLRQTNATLESIAQALFKSWFIDFDPVRAKAEGREPEGMDAATAALFPTEFEESALGLIPKGWRVVSLKDCVQIRDGKPWLLENRTESSDVAVFGANGQVGFACSSLSQGRVLFVGKIGSCGALNSFNGRWWATNNVFYISKEFNPNLEWCRHTIEGIDFKGYIGGSSNPYMPLKNFGHHPVVLPSIEVRQAFEKTVQPFRERIEQNLKDASLVSDLRDTLLPRLISGKLRLPEAQEHVEEALA
jgi:type I restriction enzyme S subunit